MNRSAFIRMFIFMIAAAVMFSTSAYAKEKTAVAKIKTNAFCEDCKDKIETALKSIDGVKEAKLNMTNKVVTIKYVVGKTNKDAFAKAILDLGYNADDAKPENPHVRCTTEGGDSHKGCSSDAHKVKATTDTKGCSAETHDAKATTDTKGCDASKAAGCPSKAKAKTETTAAPTK